MISAEEVRTMHKEMLIEPRPSLDPMIEKWLDAALLAEISECIESGCEEEHGYISLDDMEGFESLSDNNRRYVNRRILIILKHLGYGCSISDNDEIFFSWRKRLTPDPFINGATIV